MNHTQNDHHINFWAIIIEVKNPVHKIPIKFLNL